MANLIERLRDLGIADSALALWERLPERIRGHAKWLALSAVGIMWSAAIALSGFIHQFGPFGYMLAIFVAIIVSALCIGSWLWALDKIRARRAGKLDIVDQTTPRSAVNLVDMDALRQVTDETSNQCTNLELRVNRISQVTEQLYSIEHAIQLRRQLEKAKPPLTHARTQTLGRPPAAVDKYTLDSVGQLEREAIEFPVSRKLISMTDLRYELKISTDVAYSEAAKEREDNPGNESHVTAHKQHVAKLIKLEDLIDKYIRMSQKRVDVDLPSWETAITPPPVAPSDSPSPAGTARRTRPRTRPG